MKISIITWDASFREHLHTIDCFANQTHTDFEFIWVDFYQASSEVKNRISKYENCTCLELNHSSDIQWNLGTCINAGVKLSSADLLVIPDGDIIAPSDFLESIHRQYHQDMAMYFRRYDETSNHNYDYGYTSLDDLEARSKLLNPTNFAGCIALSKSLFDSLNGYEEHTAFSGPGISGMEFNTRLRNYSACIKWCKEKIFHPWHQSTGSTLSSNEDLKKLNALSLQYPWLIPYGGLRQSWIIRQRSLRLSTTASSSECDQILDQLPFELTQHL